MSMIRKKEQSRQGPLLGFNVLELGTTIAGPSAGCLLADFGAKVVKIEHPERGDDLRNWPPMKDGHSLYWKVTNRNKILITLNLSKPEGRQILLDMLPKFDVLLENFRPGTLEKWGLGYDDLVSVNPRLILARISGYGQTGPYARRPGYGTIGEAMSGVPSFTGFPDKPPTFSAFPLVDTIAGLFAVVACLMAVYERDVTGSNQGQVIDVSLYESLFRLIDSQVIGYDQLGIIKRRNGNRMDEDSPRNAYRTADGGYVAISAGSQRTFARLAAAIGADYLIGDPRFSSPENRIKNADELDEIVSGWFEKQTLQGALDQLEDADVIAGPVYDVRRIFCDPQYKARDNVITVPDEDFGSVRMQGVIPKFTRTPGKVIHSGHTLGADNEIFYSESLGFTIDKLKELRELGVI